CFEVAEVTNVSKYTEENAENSVQTGSQKLEEQSDDIPQPKEQKDHMPGSEESEATETARDGTISHETGEAIHIKPEIDLSEGTIKKAIKKRASYFRANSEKISLVGVRRLLEEDLKLEKNALDAYKKIISKQLDEVLQSPEVVETTSVGKNHMRKSTPQSKIKGSAGVGRTEALEGSSNASMSGSEDEEIDEQEKKIRKRSASKVRKNGLLKKQKISSEVSKPTGSVKKKNAEPVVERSSEAEDGGNSSDEADSHSSEEETVKKKRAAPAQSYGKRVEHLKSVIKSCGLGVPPSVYKRVKQAPESKRESYLMKELEDILSREGLSTDPSEK
ncbi:hypothetical protein Taro_051343, partial [Colocasia esculenta]|nr:hypothetical protein [Colocasia esculenta]